MISEVSSNSNSFVITWRSSRDRELWTDHNPYFPVPCTIWAGGGGRKFRREVELGKKRSGRKLFSAWSFFVTILLLFLISKKLIFPRLSLPAKVLSKQCSHLHLNWWTFSTLLFPSFVEEGDWESEWASDSHAKLTHHNSIGIYTTQQPYVWFLFSLTKMIFYVTENHRIIKCLVLEEPVSLSNSKPHHG